MAKRKVEMKNGNERLEKHYDKLFNPRENSYFFDNSAKTIEIFEGGLRIKNK